MPVLPRSSCAESEVHHVQTEDVAGRVYGKAICRSRNQNCLRKAGKTMSDKPATSTNPALDLVHEQAKDDGLWFIAKYASEAYLQNSLRELHAAVEQGAAERALAK